MIGDFLRSSGKHVATGAVNKVSRHYGKVNRKVKQKMKQAFNPYAAAKANERARLKEEREATRRLKAVTKRAKKNG